MRYWFDEPETIGALLARVRTERGISQLRLAERLCACAATTTVTRHEVSRWEREERIPSGYWLGWLAVALDLPREVLDAAAGAARRRRSRDRRSMPAEWTELTSGVYIRAAS